MNFESKLPNFAILLAVYNGMQFITEQLQSILDQVNVCLTVFVSIDSSSDGSEAWFNALSKQDHRIVVLPEGGKFGGAAKNFFRLIRDVDLSSFDYIALADQDDYWLPDKLWRAFKILNNSTFDAYSGNVIAFWSDGRKKIMNKAQAQKKWDFIFEAAGPGCTYVLTCKLMNRLKKSLRENWNEIQSITQHDWYIYAFARCHGYQWFIDSIPYMMYRQHDKNQLGANSGIKAYFYRLNQIKKGWWLHQIRLIIALSGANKIPFVRSWSKLGRLELLRLSIHASQCRRKLQDQFFFFLICCTLAIISRENKIHLDF